MATGDGRASERIANGHVLLGGALALALVPVPLRVLPQAGWLPVMMVAAFASGLVIASIGAWGSPRRPGLWLVDEKTTAPADRLAAWRAWQREFNADRNTTRKQPT